MDADIGQFAIDAENPIYPERIRARLRVVGATAVKNVAAINARLLPKIERLNRDGAAILNSRKSTTQKIYAVWALVDEFYGDTGKNVACRRGCNHCCHIAVAVTAEEAEAMGKRIGRAPRKDVRLRSRIAEGFDYGYHNPCTFLKNGECSIYAHRPVACRAHFSMDVDALLCELDPPNTSPVPHMNSMPANMLLMHVLQPTRKDCLADIREFFPRKSK